MGISMGLFVSDNRIQKIFDQKELKKRSLQSVSDLSNEIETIADADGNLWFKRAHVGKYLEIRNVRHNLRGFSSHYTRPKSEIEGVVPYSTLGRTKNIFQYIYQKRYL